MISNTPLSLQTESIAERTWVWEGDEKMSPQTAAESIPSQTKPAWEGSCPDPPPQIKLTLLFSFEFFKKTIFSFILIVILLGSTNAFSPDKHYWIIEFLWFKKYPLDWLVHSCIILY